MEKSNPMLIKMRAQHGICLYENSKPEESMHLLNEAVEWANEAGHQDMPEVLVARHYKAMNLVNLGFEEQAAVQHLEVNEDFKRVFGENHPATLKNYIDLANTLVRCQKFEKAEEICLLLEKKQEQHGLKNTPDYCKGQMNLIAGYLTSGRLAEGRAILLKL